jgi:hypothetical protein
MVLFIVFANTLGNEEEPVEVMSGSTIFEGRPARLVIANSSRAK